jgi:choline kinase
MKALILAAGFGSRLMPITQNLPKALVSVNGKPILYNQIESLLENGITDITIIAGYKGTVVKDAVCSHWDNIKVVENENYSSTNNMYSAYLGIQSTGISDLIMMNADVFFDHSVIRGLLEYPFPNAIVTDVGTYYEESMKVIERDGYLIEISKTIKKQDALGSSIDVYKFDAIGTQMFYNKCKEYIENQKDLKKWSEVALNAALKEIGFKACPLNGRWFEIDNHDDLKMAEKLFAPSAR